MPKTKYPIFKCLHRGEKGFTLIELLIVVAILAIIAAVVIPNITRFMAIGAQAAANSEAEQVKTAALGFFGEFSTWPNSSDELTTTGYITGTLGATYVISGNASQNCGWLLSASIANSTKPWPNTIMFEAGVDGLTGYHGKWVRNPAA
jgi:prepilin-type N-terminal cleavage/methylation domain-containing protein